MPKINDEGMQTTPDLDQAMREGQHAFAGDDPEGSVAEPRVPGSSGPEEKNDEEDGEKKAAETAPEGETDEEKAARIKKEDTPPDPTFRFKDHSEAERGYRELQGRTTKAEQRAKAIEDELNRVKNAERIKEETAAARKTVIDYAATRHEKALEDIDGLDPEDPGYRKKAATILSQANIDIYDHYQTHGRTAPNETTSAAAKEMEADPAKRQEEVTKYVKEKIAAEGFDENDPLFWQYAGHAPVNDEQGKPATIDSQIAWAVSQVKQYHESIRTKLKSEEEAKISESVRKKQAADMPLGRGTPGGGSAPRENTAPQEETPVSLSDALDFAQDRRRL